MAARALGNLAYCNDANQILIAEAGGVPPLVHLLRNGSAEAKLRAARALGSLAFNDDNIVLIAEAGGIAPLVELVRDGSAEAKEKAAWALCWLAGNDDNLVLIAEARGIPPLVHLLRVGSAKVKVMAASNAAHALCSLAGNDDNLVLITEAAASALALIAEAGAVPPLVDLLRDGIAADAKLMAARALRQITRDNDANAVAVLAFFGLEPLVQLARRGRVTVAIDVDRWNDSDSDSEGAAPLAAEYDRTIVYSAGHRAKRKAALVVAALFKDCVAGEVPDDIKAAIGSYL
ncbi:hypothetical protein JL722_10418 [Aureococcus anophagefferens]|nr:hypothetical protein JL722_10418 [Aureococcus anophagefferens]